MIYTVDVNRHGEIYWYKEGTGILHREDGPAIECVSGDKSWYINGKKLTEEEFNKRNKVFTKEQLKKMSLEELHQLIS